MTDGFKEMIDDYNNYKKDKLRLDYLESQALGGLSWEGYKIANGGFLVRTTSHTSCSRTLRDEIDRLINESNWARELDNSSRR